MKHIKIILLAFLLIAKGVSSHAQKQVASEFEIKAAFLYNFTRFVEWPESAFKSPTDPFVIGIIGDDPFGSILRQVVADEKVGLHPIIITHIKDTANMKNCHILFINSDDSDYIKKIIGSLGSASILTVSDQFSFPRFGGHIRFFIEDKRIRLHINSSAVKKSNLHISSKLLSLAKIY